MTDQYMNEEVEEPPQPEDVLYIFNMSEDVLPFIQSLPESNQKLEISENARLCGREYLGIRAAYPDHHITMISPAEVDLDYVDYIDDLIDGSANIYVPRLEHTGKICEELLQDDVLYKRVIRRDYKVVSYCNSPYLYKLLNKFKASGALMNTSEIPSEAAWAKIEPMGTKTGFRRLIDQIKTDKIQMSPGDIYPNYLDAVESAVQHNPNQGIVFKTEKGHAGMGVTIFRPNNFSQDINECRNEIMRRLQEEDGYWEKFAVVLERYVDTDPSVGGGFPNIEGYINSQGEVKINYPCGMRILPGGVFAGVEIGKNVLDQQVVDQMYEIGQKIGQIYADNGYVGYFEFDFLASKDGTLFLGESNIRRNGGTYAYQLGKYLFGPDLLDEHYIVTQLVPIRQKNLSFGPVFDATRSLQLEEGREEGVLLTAPDVLPLGKLGYFVAAENRDHAIQIETEFLRRIEELDIRSTNKVPYDMAFA